MQENYLQIYLQIVVYLFSLWLVFGNLLEKLTLFIFKRHTSDVPFLIRGALFSFPVFLLSFFLLAGASLGTNSWRNVHLIFRCLCFSLRSISNQYKWKVNTWTFFSFSLLETKSFPQYWCYVGRRSCISCVLK